VSPREHDLAIGRQERDVIALGELAAARKEAETMVGTASPTPGPVSSSGAVIGVDAPITPNTASITPIPGSRSSNRLDAAFQPEHPPVYGGQVCHPA
jgi:hypothetical protein